MKSSYFRLSVTNICNLDCFFCHNEGQSDDKLSYLNADEMIWATKVAVSTGFSKIKITGGEPTLRKDIYTIINNIKSIGVTDVSMITNGVTLKKMAHPLKESGLDRINVSLYTLNAEKFTRNQRAHPQLLHNIQEGIDAALAAGFKDIKLNYIFCDDGDFPDFINILKFARCRDLTVVALPVMRNNSILFPDFSLSRLNEKIAQLTSIVQEKDILDEVGIIKTLVLTNDGSKILVRKNELNAVTPFNACKKCLHLSACQEGIFPMRLSSDGILSPCLANPELRKNIRQIIQKRDVNSLIEIITGMSDL